MFISQVSQNVYWKSPTLEMDSMCGVCVCVFVSVVILTTFLFRYSGIVAWGSDISLLTSQ
jgi:hypothetical protein